MKNMKTHNGISKSLKPALLTASLLLLAAASVTAPTAPTVRGANAAALEQGSVQAAGPEVVYYPWWLRYWPV